LQTFSKNSEDQPTNQPTDQPTTVGIESIPIL
jgi:hypothetical protein